jgi:hypothetical protein
MPRKLLVISVISAFYNAEKGDIINPSRRKPQAESAKTGGNAPVKAQDDDGTVNLRR